MDAYDVLGGPVLRTQLPATPAAGADWTFTVPGRVALEILAVKALLTTAVAVATRLPALTISDGTNVVAALPGSAGEAASIAETYTWMPEVSPIQSATGGANSAALPKRLILPPGFVIASQTGNIQAADTWTNITIWTREIPEYGMGAEIQTSLYRAATHISDIADVLGVDLSQ